MKSISIFSLLVILSFPMLGSVLIVDNKANRPSGSNIYATIALAYDAAQPGDTLLITPSSAPYANFVISKSINIIGGGFNAAKDNQMYSTVDVITITTGVTDVLISGMVITGYINVGNSGSVSNVVIEKNKISYVTTSATTLSNIVIRKNFFSTTANTYPVSFTAANQSNIIFTNNIFSRIYSYGVYVTNGGVTFDHNLFLGNGNMYAIYSLENCLVSNNIFYGSYAIPNVASVINYQNNIIYGTTDNTIPVGAGYTSTDNIENTDPLFVNMPVGQYNYTLDASLQTGSPAIGAGNDGMDLGIYGGLTPYKNTGVSLPVVKTVIMPTAIVQGTDTNADIVVTGN